MASAKLSRWQKKTSWPYSHALIYLGYYNVYIRRSPLCEIYLYLENYKQTFNFYLKKKRADTYCINTCTSICTYPNVCTLMLPFASVENLDSITRYVWTASLSRWLVLSQPHNLQ